MNTNEMRASAAMREAGKHVFCGANPNWIDHAGDCDAAPCTCGLSNWLNANMDLLGINLRPTLKAKVGHEEFPPTGPVGNTSPVDTATGDKPPPPQITFEKWASDHALDRTRLDGRADVYADPRTAWAWKAWQANQT